MQLFNTANDTYLPAQFNPSGFEESLGANYSRQQVLGLSHQVKQFSNTEDTKFTFSLFHRATDGGRAELDRILFARTFLRASCHPRQANTLKTGGAPRLLFIWPTFLVFECVLTSVRFKYTQFNFRGEPTAYTADVTLEEVRDMLVTMQDVLDGGGR